VDGALVIIDAEGRYVDGNAAALEILGVTLDELRSASSATFAAGPVDPEQAGAFRVAWEAAGRPDITGETTVRRPDGDLARVRFAITLRADDTYAAAFERISGPASGPVALRTMGAVLAAWRAAERRLESLEPGSQEWTEAQDEVAWLRDQHATVFRQQRERSPAAS
jgi:PAS domain S-box-containing protein